MADEVLLIKKSSLTGIADAVRAKTGKTDPIPFDNLKTEIEGITGGGSSGESSDLVKYVTFLAEDGTQLFKMPVLNGDDCKDPVEHGDISEPTKESSNTQNFAYSGWTSESGGSADGDILKNITEDKTVYVSYTASVRYYTVNFYDEDGTTLLKTVQVTYGADASGSAPNKDGYILVTMTPDITNITGDTDVIMTWAVDDGYIHDDWSVVVERAKAGTLANYYDVGKRKELVLTYADGSTETIDVVLTVNNGISLYTYEDSTFNSSAKANAVFVADHILKTEYALASSTLGSYKTIYYDPNGFYRSVLNGTIYNALPEELRNAIISRARGTGTTSNPRIGAKLWLPQEAELKNGSPGMYNRLDISAVFGTDDSSKRIKYKKDSTNASEWWTEEDTQSGTFYNYYYVKTDGSITSTEETDEKGIIFGFCI